MLSSGIPILQHDKNCGVFCTPLFQTFLVQILSSLLLEMSALHAGSVEIFKLPSGHIWCVNIQVSFAMFYLSVPTEHG